MWIDVTRTVGDTYSFTAMMHSPYGTDVKTGTFDYAGGLPCCVAVPYFGRDNTFGTGYITPGPFSWAPKGGPCTFAAFSPSGSLPFSYPVITPGSLLITCEAICDVVTITPERLALFGADTISYEVSDSEDFASILYSIPFRALDSSDLASEVGVISGVLPGRYYGRYIVRYGSAGVDETSETCATSSSLTCSMRRWGGWRTAADLVNEDPIAGFRLGSG